MKKRVAIIQSNYIPWKGYFNIIRDSDEFVLLDDVQYTRRDWRNRNLIKTKSGLKWLTIPVAVKGNYNIQIKDVMTVDNSWRKKHWNEIMTAYKESTYFEMYRAPFESLYLDDDERHLSLINYKFIKLIASFLNITTPVRWSMEFNAPAEKTRRLLYICKELKATEYISGLAAKNYLDESLFEDNGVKIQWADYLNYPVYDQLSLPFEHGVSIIDLLFSQGPNSSQYLKEVIY